MTVSNNLKSEPKKEVSCAIVGEKDLVEIFAAASFDTYYTDRLTDTDPDAGIKVVEQIAANYKIILTTFPVPPALLGKYDGTPYPIIVQIFKEVK